MCGRGFGDGRVGGGEEAGEEGGEFLWRGLFSLGSNVLVPNTEGIIKISICISTHFPLQARPVLFSRPLLAREVFWTQLSASIGGSSTASTLSDQQLRHFGGDCVSLSVRCNSFEPHGL